MVAERKQPTLTVEAYLALEAAGHLKHEYVHGSVYAMADGTLAHDIIANNVRAALHAHVGAGPCVVLGPDARVRAGEAVYYYPDAVVVCGEVLDDRALEVTAPRLLVEVLSDATENVDRGGKFADYQTLPSLQEYLLVDSRRRAVECYRRVDGDRWTYQRYTADHPITLESVGLTCAASSFYLHMHAE